MLTNASKLTLQDFWALSPGETNYELINGEAKLKMAANKFHSSLQRVLLRLFED